MRTIVSGVALSLVTTGLTAIVSASAAQASGTFQAAPSVQIGYTDSAAPGTAFPWTEAVNLPLGSRTADDGVVHTSRVYATYDLSAFVGKHVLSGKLRIREQTAADCTKRAIELWQTKTVTTTPSWGSSPAEVTKLDEILTPEFCPTATITFDALPAVLDALAHGKTKITVELRVPAALETSVAYGRTLNWYSTVVLTVEYNTPPTVTTEHLYNNNLPCARSAPGRYVGGPDVVLQAMLADPDWSARLTAEYAIWPANRPSERTVITDDSITPDFVEGVHVPDEVIVDGGTYAWQVRALDGVDTSAWTKPCVFTVDNTSPSAPPGVTSPTYPETTDGVPLPGGVPGTFTFTAGGVPDAYAYQYQWNGEFSVFGCELKPYNIPNCPDFTKNPGVVRADRLGGSATVRLSPPAVFDNTLNVRTLDRAGRVGPTRAYRIVVASTAPVVTPSTTTPTVGQPLTLTFAPGPNVTNVKTYTYRVNYGDEQTVKAKANGTAKITITPNDGGSWTVGVRSHSANGWDSPEASWFAYIDTSPRITSAQYPADQTSGGVGVTGTFTFSPRMPNVTEYTYYLEDVSDTVAAGPDGTATIEYTPTRSGGHFLQVTANTASGQTSAPAYYYFTVQSNAPVIEGPYDPRIGVPTEYHLSATGSPTEFAYSVYNGSWGDEHTVPASADGTATITVTPTQSQYLTIQAYSVYADGTRSEAGYFGGYVPSNAPMFNSITIGVAGTPAEFVMAPNTANVVAYVYQVNDGPEQTVPAVADGTGTITFTPAEPGWIHLVIRSRQADGSLSEANDNNFYVPEPPAP